MTQLGPGRIRLAAAGEIAGELIDLIAGLGHEPARENGDAIAALAAFEHVAILILIDLATGDA